MKNITFFPLSPHYFKYIGVLVTLTGLTMLLFDNPDFELMVYAGLLIMIFSKERNETGSAGLIRSEVFKTVFGYIYSVGIALHFTDVLSDGFAFEVTPFLGIGVPLLLYLVVFYGISIFTVPVDSSLDVAQNLKNHRRFYMSWLFITIVISGIMVLKIVDVI